jgi:hypothetical protein
MKKFKIGDLVWIPAFTDLLILGEPYDNNGIISRRSIKTTHREEPCYGLVTETETDTVKVLIEKENYFVRTKQIYGAEDDYLPGRSY